MKTLLFTSVLFFIVQSKTTYKDTSTYRCLAKDGQEYTIFSSDTSKTIGDTIYYDSGRFR